MAARRHAVSSTKPTLREELVAGAIAGALVVLLFFLTIYGVMFLFSLAFDK
jgi:hypothetical protein